MVEAVRRTIAELAAQPLKGPHVISDMLGSWLQLVAVGDQDPADDTYLVTAAGRPPTRLPGTLLVEVQPYHEHDGLAHDEHGVALRSLPGTLYYDPFAGADTNAEKVGGWRLAGVGHNPDIVEGDDTAAFVWAADLLPGEVTDWTLHIDDFGDFWTPVYIPSAPAGAGVVIQYRIETAADDGKWAEASRGQTPPLYPLLRDALLDSVARTILVSAPDVLRLDHRRHELSIRVSTWATGIEQTGHAETGNAISGVGR